LIQILLKKYVTNLQRNVPVLEVISSTPLSSFGKWIRRITYLTPFKEIDIDCLSSCSALKILNLTDSLCNYTTPDKKRYILSSLRESLIKSGCTLQELNLSRNAIGSSITELIPLLSSVESLILRDIGLESEDALEIFKFFNPCIRSLDLSQNNLGSSVKFFNKIWSFWKNWPQFKPYTICCCWFFPQPSLSISCFKGIRSLRQWYIGLWLEGWMVQLLSLDSLPSTWSH